MGTRTMIDDLAAASAARDRQRTGGLLWSRLRDFDDHALEDLPDLLNVGCEGRVGRPELLEEIADLAD